MNTDALGRSGENLTDLSDPVIRAKKAAARYACLSDNFDEYKKHWLKKHRSAPFDINKPNLMDAVESYFNDIQRLKAFHGMTVADRFKVASYTMRWLAKIRPIYLKSENLGVLNQKKDSILLTLNAGFAFAIGCNMAGAGPREADPKFVSQVLYTLQYRDVEPGFTALFMELFAARWPKKQPSEVIYKKNPPL